MEWWRGGGWKQNKTKQNKIKYIPSNVYKSEGFCTNFLPLAGLKIPALPLVVLILIKKKKGRKLQAIVAWELPLFPSVQN